MSAKMKPLGTKALCTHALCGVATLMRLNDGGEVALVAVDVATLIAASDQLNPNDRRPLLVSKMRHVLFAPQTHSFVVDGTGSVGEVVNADSVWPLTTWWETEGWYIYESDADESD